MGNYSRAFVNLQSDLKYIKLILSASFFAASVSEMEAAGESLERATQLADSEGGGFLTTFGVYHELHCLVSWLDNTLFIHY